MKLNRQKLLSHLDRILCRGQFNEVVFQGGFAATALHPDQMLMVIAPDLPTPTTLEGEVGVPDVKQFADALKTSRGEGNVGAEVELFVANSRLVIDDTKHGSLYHELIIASPKTIGTRVEEDLKRKILAGTQSAGSIPLTRALVEGVTSAFSLYHVEELTLQITPTGSQFIIGNDRTNRGRLAVDYKSKGDEYSLLFGRQLIDVFTVVTDYSSATLKLGGAQKPILIEDAGYKYLVSPRLVSADEVKAQVKSNAPALPTGLEGDGEEEAAAPRSAKKKAAKKVSAKDIANGRGRA